MKTVILELVERRFRDNFVSAEFVPGSDDEIDLEIISEFFVNIFLVKFPNFLLLLCVTTVMRLSVFFVITFLDL